MLAAHQSSMREIERQQEGANMEMNQLLKTSPRWRQLFDEAGVIREQSGPEIEPVTVNICGFGFCLLNSCYAEVCTTVSDAVYECTKLVG